MTFNLPLFDHAETYPNRPGFKRTDTSKAAAESAAPNAEILRERILDALKALWPMTADEMAEHLGEDKLSIRPRFSELNAQGLIRDTAIRRKNASGKSAICWEAK